MSITKDYIHNDSHIWQSHVKENIWSQMGGAAKKLKYLKKKYLEDSKWEGPGKDLNWTTTPKHSSLNECVYVSESEKRGLFYEPALTFWL